MRSYWYTDMIVQKLGKEFIYHATNPRRNIGKLRLATALLSSGGIKGLANALDFLDKLNIGCVIPIVFRWTLLRYI